MVDVSDASSHKAGDRVSGVKGAGGAVFFVDPYGVMPLPSVISMVVVSLMIGEKCVKVRRDLFSEDGIRLFVNKFLP